MAESITPSLLVDLFPTNIRCTGLALPINIGNGFFGGTASIVITFLMHVTNNSLIPAFYLMFIALITLLVTLSLGQSGLKLNTN
jgi:MHS family proline/betaine transporter-like MFS transporter